MPILQLFKCDVCGTEHIEAEPGAGAGGWGSLQGIVLNGVSNPVLCPPHKKIMAEKLDALSGDFTNDLG